MAALEGRRGQGGKLARHNATRAVGTCGGRCDPFKPAGGGG